MPSSYTTRLRLEKPATGELSGTWGDRVNNGITDLVDSALAGYTSIAMTDANYTLSQANGAADESRSMMLNMTGTLTANRNVVCPNVSKFYVFRNSTTGGFSLVLKTSSGTGVTVPNAKVVTVFCDGADNIFDVTNYFTGSLTVNGALTANSTFSAATVTATSIFSAPLGSAGAPSYTFTGDTNNGMWSPAADTIAFSTTGFERVRIDSSGKVGIGGTPTAALDVFNGAVHLTDGFSITWGDATASIFGNAATDILLFNTNNTERVRIDASGNVGIGGAPTSLLDVFKAGAVFARIRATDGSNANLLLQNSATGTGNSDGFEMQMGGDGLTAAVWNFENGATLFGTNNTERMRIDASGNVGIGVAPETATRLHVHETTAPRIRMTHGTSGVTATDGFALTFAASDAYVWNYENGQMLFGTNNTERMRIDASGNVGIGNIPTYKLDVSGTIRAQASGNSGFFYSNVTGVNVETAGTAPLLLITNGTERMRITGAGVIQDAAALELGWKDIPSSTNTGTATLGLTNRSKCIQQTDSATLTVPASVFSAGMVVSIYNHNSASMTIAQGASLTLRLAGTTTTGNRTLAARGFATVYFVTATEAIVSGSGVS